MREQRSKPPAPQPIARVSAQESAVALPTSVVVGSLAAIVYGIMHIVTTIVFLTMIAELGAADAAEKFGNNAVIAIVAFVVAAKLRRRQQWAWWIAMFYGVLVAVRDAFGIPLVVGADMTLPLAILVAVFSVETLALWVVIIALYRPSSRVTFGVLKDKRNEPAA